MAECQSSHPDEWCEDERLLSVRKRYSYWHTVSASQNAVNSDAASLRIVTIRQAKTEFLFD